MGKPTPSQALGKGWLFLALYKSSDIYFNIYWALIYSSLRLGRVWHADVADALPRRISTPYGSCRPP